MADIEMVMFGFFRIRIARIVPETRIVDIAGLSPREHLVRIALVRNVENELVPWGIENIVQRDFRFDGSEVRSKMPAYLGKPVEKGFANVRGKRFEFLGGHLLHVCRSVYLL